MAKNEVLKHEAEPYLNRACEEFEKTQTKQKLFGGLIYGAKSWKRKRHVICKAEVTEKGLNPRFVVTSLMQEDQELYEKVYCQRAEMENRIKEQMMLFPERTSAHRWWANQWRLLLSALAYTLLETIRRIGLKGTAFAKTQCHWLRLKIIKIATLIERTKSRVRLKMPSAYPHKQTFMDCLQRLRPT